MRANIQYALISTSDKTNLIEFAQQLHTLNIKIIATGGSAKLLRDNDIPVIEVSDYTGFPEIMDGRVKTLHPKIHGGLLGRRDLDASVMQQHEINAIDLVIVNLYPFSQTIAKPSCTLGDAIENIDIGGPSMLRSAAKNHTYVTVVVDPSDYATVITEIQQQGHTSLELRQRLAQKVFAHTAQYDATIANYFAQQYQLNSDSLPTQLTLSWHKQAELRYGENPQQQAAFYRPSAEAQTGFANAKQLQGKELSFNNLMDSDAAIRCVLALPSDLPSCVIVKHATPCGAAQAENLLAAYQRAYATDPSSAFGGIIAFNRELDATTAEAIGDQFAEVIIAPAVSEAARAILARKTNLRVLEFSHPSPRGFTLHSLSGGVLMQQEDYSTLTAQGLKIVTQLQPTPAQIQDMLFAWQIVRFVKSNAIVYAKDRATIGLGGGQTSRVFSSEIAILKAQQADLTLPGSVMASDAFFPFADSIELAAKAGITAIIQPGGSKRDDEVIKAANAAGIAMAFTNTRHFRH